MALVGQHRFLLETEATNVKEAGFNLWCRVVKERPLAARLFLGEQDKFGLFFVWLLMNERVLRLEKAEQRMSRLQKCKMKWRTHKVKSEIEDKLNS